MKVPTAVVLFLFVLVTVSFEFGAAKGPKPSSSSAIFGFQDASVEAGIESRFLAVPDPKLAEQHLRTLTQAPHMAGTPEDKATADYVAQKFREALATYREAEDLINIGAYKQGSNPKIDKAVKLIDGLTDYLRQAVTEPAEINRCIRELQGLLINA